MSEEIRQELGFSASQALQTLRELDKVLAVFEGRLGSSVRAMSGFNKQGGKTVSALKQIDSWAKKASGSIDRLNRNLGRMPAAQAPGAQSSTTGFSEPRRQIDQMLLGGSQAKEHFDNWFSTLGAQIKKSEGLWQQWGTRVRDMLGLAKKGSRDFGTSTRQSMDEAGRAVNRVTVDWHTMVRIVTTQAIVRALSMMRNALKASVREAVEFERRVAEIRTISTERNLGRLKDAVRELSDEFNVPWGQVSEGVYQTISNQVADGAGAFQFFGESVKFSKVAVADADDAVNLLTGTAKELEAAQVKIVELLRPVDESGKLLDPQALAGNRAEAAKLVKQFLAQAMGQDLPVTRMLDFSGVRQALQKEIQGVDLLVVAASPKALERLRDQIQSAIDRFDLNTTIKAKVEWEEAAGTKIQTLDDWDRVSGFAAGELERLNSLIAATSAAMTAVEESAASANRALERIERPAVEPAQLGSYASPEAHVAQAQLMAAFERQQAINELTAKFRELAEAERVTKEELKAVIDQVEALDKNTAVSGFWGIHADEWRAFGDAATAVYEKIQKFRSLDLSGTEGGFQRAREEAEAARQKYEELEQKARQAFEAPLAPAQGARQATLDTQAAIQSAVAPAAQIAGSMASIRADAQAAAAALRSMPAAPMSSKGGLRFRTGGPVPAMHYLASGGRARGIDRIPAMLAPGEFVVNQRSSRQFFSQLQAINAGSRPVYRDSGGQVTHVGDVSITIAESSTPKQTAREIMAAIRRESRRGSSRL